MEKGEIRHHGKVISVFDGGVGVAVTPEAACASCRMKGACGMEDGGQRIIMVQTTCPARFSEGEEVAVTIKQVMGFKAVFYVYILPFLMVFFSLVVFITVGINEGLAGVLSLGILGLYYFLLYLFRKKVGKEISFQVYKI